MMNAKKKELG
jgi:hypothetical protein